MALNYSINPSLALIDNWSLELSCKLLYGDFYGLNEFNQASSYADKNIFGQPTNENLVALFQLLDLIVTTDELLYDGSFAMGWISMGGLRPIQPILKEVELNLESEIVISVSPDEEIYFDSPNDDIALVRGGALYYLRLAQAIGAYYWPAPQRAIFLSEHFYINSQPGYLVSLKKTVDSSLEKMIKEIYSGLNMPEPNLNFPGFGASILASCNSPKIILQTAMEFRETKESRIFRQWLRQMDIALQQGDMKAIARALRDINEIVNLVNKELDSKGQHANKVELQIGLSPSLTIDNQLINSVLGGFKPKPYHLSFLRNHFSRVLDTNIWDYAKRLFK